MNLSEIIDRLTTIDQAVFFDNPYARARNIADEDIDTALMVLDEDADVTEVRLPFLLDYSREVQAMAGNFGEDLSDDEVADRVEKFWEDNFGQAN